MEWLLLCWHLHQKLQLEECKKGTQQSSIPSGWQQRKTQRRKEHERKLRKSLTHLNCYSTQDVSLQLSLGVGNTQSRKSSKCWVDTGWEVFKVIGNGWSHPPRSSQAWLILSVTTMSLTVLNSLFETFVVFEPHYQLLCCLLLALKVHPVNNYTVWEADRKIATIKAYKIQSFCHLIAS